MIFFFFFTLVSSPRVFVQFHHHPTPESIFLKSSTCLGVGLPSPVLFTPSFHLFAWRARTIAKRVLKRNFSNYRVRSSTLPTLVHYHAMYHKPLSMSYSQRTMAFILFAPLSSKPRIHTSVQLSTHIVGTLFFLNSKTFASVFSALCMPFATPTWLRSSSPTIAF